MAEKKKSSSIQQKTQPSPVALHVRELGEIVARAEGMANHLETYGHRQPADVRVEYDARQAQRALSRAAESVRQLLASARAFSKRDEGVA